MVRVAFTTLGCRFNQNETLEMEESLGCNYMVVPYSCAADIYVINSCTVTGKSDRKCRNIIRRTFKRSPASKIIVTGCYAETQKEEISNIQGVSLVVGNSKKGDIKSLISGLACSQGLDGQLPVSVKSPHSDSRSTPRRTSAYLKVQSGCDMSCSYCIVTVARGKGQSKPVAQIKREFEKLVLSGVNEIVLTGINLGRYGHDFKERVSVASLLEELLAIKGVARIRLSSINPLEVSDKLIGLIKTSRFICRHLHIPLQSGDNEVLRDMRRNYNAEIFQHLVNRLNGEVNGIGVGTDVIAGFPGESEQAFFNTYELIRKLPLSYLHVFRYSRRNGTDASKFSPQVSSAVKMERSKALIELGNKKKLTFRKEHLNKVVNVLFETRESGSDCDLVGYSDNYIPVIVKGANRLKNSIRSVRLLSIENEKVRGVLM